MLDLLEKLDGNGDGEISLDEMAAMLRERSQEMSERRLLKKGLACSIIVVVILIITVALMVIVSSVATTSVWVTETAEKDPNGLKYVDVLNGESVTRSAKPDGNLLTRFAKLDFANTGEVVATAAAEDVWEVEADTEAFARLSDVGAFRQRPKLVGVFFNDSSLLQFPPGTVQAFEGSAKITNFEVGVTLELVRGAMPSVVYHGGAGRLSVQSGGALPSGPTQERERKGRAPPAIVKLQIVQPDAVNVVKLEAVAADSSAPVDLPIEATQARQEERAALTRNLKVLLPLKQLRPQARASADGALLTGSADTWFLLGCTTVSYFRSVCERFEKGSGFSGKCGMSNTDFESRFGNLTAGIASSGSIPIKATHDQIDRFREAMRDEGNPCFCSLQKGFVTSTERASYRPVPPPDPSHEIHPDPEHAELQRSVRRLIAATPGGRAIAAAATARLHRSQVAELGEEEHMRRLQSWYRRDEKIVQHESCYQVTGPGFFRGEKDAHARTCVAEPSEYEDDMEGMAEWERTNEALFGCRGPSAKCVPWEEVLNHPKCRGLLGANPTYDAGQKRWVGSKTLSTFEQISCICDIIGGTARPWQQRITGGEGATFTGAWARALCVGLDAPDQEKFRYSIPTDLGGGSEYKPFCFYRGREDGSVWQAKNDNAAAIKNGWFLKPALGRVNPCYSDYYRTAREVYGGDAFSRVHNLDDTERPPFDESYGWHLARIAENGPPAYRKSQDYETLFNQMAYKGSDVHVFVVDCGINHEHRDLRGKVGIGVDFFTMFSNELNSANECKQGQSSMALCGDENGHGTHVAGIVAGDKYGIARDVKLHSVKICGSSGKMFIDPPKVSKWIVDKMKLFRQQAGCAAGATCKKTYGIVVFSQGLKANGRTGVNNEVIDNFARDILKEKISFVNSAGNDQVDSCTASPNNVLQDNNDRGMVSVGATDMVDSRGAYSNHGSCITLFAPGTGIISTGKQTTTGYATMTGTSQAAPVVAGILALGAQKMMAEGSTPTPTALRAWLVGLSLSNKVKQLQPTTFFPDWVLDAVRVMGDEAAKFKKYDSFYSFLFDPLSDEELKDPTIHHATNKLAHVPVLQGLRRARKLALARAREEGMGAGVVRDELGEALMDLIAEQRSEPDGELHPALRRRLEGNATSATTCNATVRVADESTPCPSLDQAVCGEQYEATPSGEMLLRPFRRVLTECAVGCVCEPAALAVVSYESCSPDPCAYTYTNMPCHNVFSINSTEEAGRASGLKLSFAPLAGRSGFNQPTVVAFDAKVDERYATGDGGEHSIGGVRVTHTKPTPLDLDDEDSILVSIPAASNLASSLIFQGKHYTTINVASNGYVSFGPLLCSVTSEATEAAHFSVEKGLSFSMLLADLKKPNAYITHLEQIVVLPGANGTESEPYTVPFATVVTFLNAELETFETEPTTVTTSVQASFEHTTGIVQLTLGEVPAGIIAMVGPSSGDADHGSDVNSMSTLLDGKLLANDTSTALCDQAAADAAQAEDGTEEASGGSD